MFVFKISIYLLGCTGSQLWHVGSLVVACELLVAECRIWLPDQGSVLGPPHWEGGVLATGPPGKSHIASILYLPIGKESACNAGDPDSIPGSGRSSGEGNGNPLQYSCLENPTDRGAWWPTDHGVTKSQTQLTNTNSTKKAASILIKANSFK